MTQEAKWEPIPAQVLASPPAPGLAATGFLRLNKPALHDLMTRFAKRRNGPRDLMVLLELMCRAEYSTRYKVNPAEGAVFGSDAEASRLTGQNRTTFVLAVDRLAARGYVTRIDANTPRGYRVPKPVWMWLTAAADPPHVMPDDLDMEDPFDGSPYARGARGGEY